MKRYLMSIIIAIMILTPVLLVGCAQETKSENRIASLERKLTATESTIKVLQIRIEQLENESLTEEEILATLYGKEFLADVGPLQQGSFWVNREVSIKFKGLRGD
jgi:outer membrane murein-binding lipoprotein Lpp